MQLERARGRRRRWAPGAVLAALLVAASVAAQQPARRPVAVEWITPHGEGCPDVRKIEAEIARLLAGSDIAEEGRLRARAEASHEGGTWRVRVTTQDGGDRSLEAESCAALADATSLVLALAVDPARVAVNRAATSASTPSAIPTPTATPTAPPTATAPPTTTATATATATATPTLTPTATTPPSRPPSPPITHRFAFGPTLSLDLGTLPHASPGVGAALAWILGTPRGGVLRLEIAGAYYPTETTEVSTSPSRGGKFQLATFDARACALLLWSPLEISPCVGGELAVMLADGFGVVDTPATTTWGGLLGGGMLAYRVTSLVALRFGLEAVLPLSRPTFDITNLGFVHRPAAVAGRASLGVELRF